MSDKTNLEDLQELESLKSAPDIIKNLHVISGTQENVPIIPKLPNHTLEEDLRLLGSVALGIDDLSGVLKEEILELATKEPLKKKYNIPSIFKSNVKNYYKKSKAAESEEKFYTFITRLNCLAQDLGVPAEELMQEVRSLVQKHSKYFKEQLKPEVVSTWDGKDLPEQEITLPEDFLATIDSTYSYRGGDKGNRRQPDGSFKHV